MIYEYTQSEETYKGFILKMRRYKLNWGTTYHRQCVIFRDNQRVGICKTKKEAKDLIAHGCFR